MLSRFDDWFLAFVLRERKTAVSRTLAGRMRHALITGASVDERNAKTIKGPFWGCALILAVFAINAGDA